MPSCSKSFKWLQTTQLARKQWRRRDENGSGFLHHLFVDSAPNDLNEVRAKEHPWHDARIRLDEGQQLLFAGVSVCLCHAPADVCKTGEAIEVRDSSRFSIDWISPGFLMCVLVCVAVSIQVGCGKMNYLW
jgi:hypothetical protein